MDFVIQDPPSVRVHLVERLPAACGGGVVVADGEERWILLEPPPDMDVPEEVDRIEWADRGRAMIERGEPAACADFARWYDVTVEEAQAVFWAAAFEWMERSSPAWAD